MSSSLRVTGGEVGETSEQFKFLVVVLVAGVEEQIATVEAENLAYSDSILTHLNLDFPICPLTERLYSEFAEPPVDFLPVPHGISPAEARLAAITVARFLFPVICVQGEPDDVVAEGIAYPDRVVSAEYHF
jgi:hypothetical protein